MVFFINEVKYFKDLLKKFEMDKCKTISTPISTSCHLDQDPARKYVDQTKYRGLISSLLYLTTSRPYIMFVVCMCVRFQSAPNESHFNVAKRISEVLIRNQRSWLMVSMQCISKLNWFF